MARWFDFGRPTVAVGIVGSSVAQDNSCSLETGSPDNPAAGTLFPIAAAGTSSRVAEDTAVVADTCWRVVADKSPTAADTWSATADIELADTSSWFGDNSAAALGAADRSAVDNPVADMAAAVVGTEAASAGDRWMPEADSSTETLAGRWSGGTLAAADSSQGSLD